MQLSFVRQGWCFPTYFPKFFLKSSQRSLETVARGEPFVWDWCVDCVEDHNCVRELRSVVQQQQTRLNDLQMDVNEMRIQYTELRRELRTVRVCTSTTPQPCTVTVCWIARNWNCPHSMRCVAFWSDSKCLYSSIYHQLMSWRKFFSVSP